MSIAVFPLRPLMGLGLVNLFGLALLAGEAPSLAPTVPQVQSIDDNLRKSFQLAPFYAKCLVIESFPIVASEKVSDYALLEAGYIIHSMLGKRTDLLHILARRSVRCAVMAYSEITTDIPEHSDLRPKDYWDRRARGLGATPIRPAVTCGEENLLEYPGDPYRGENILVHEFAHAVHEMALRTEDPSFERRLRECYALAMREGLWKDTYAASNHKEYWAEGVQSWFDCNRSKDRQHNGIALREELQKYDPRLAQLVAEVFRSNGWRYRPPSRRSHPGHLAGLDRNRLPTFSWPQRLRKLPER